MNDALVTSVASREVWKKLMIGPPRADSVENYREHLNKAGFRVGAWAYDIREKTPIATEPQELDLVVVTPRELGFTDLTCYDEICRRAKERGYDLCPAEVALALRLSYVDQPLGERLIVAMEPLTDGEGYLRVFDVAHDGLGLWLDTDYGEPGHEWSPERRFVFVRPKS